MIIRRVRRVLSNPGADVLTSVYEAHTSAGIFTLSKVFYAQGPSLFTWELDGPGQYLRGAPLDGFTTKKAALEFIERLGG